MPRRCYFRRARRYVLILHTEKAWSYFSHGPPHADGARVPIRRSRSCRERRRKFHYFYLRFTRAMTRMPPRAILQLIMPRNMIAFYLYHA